MSSKTVLTVPEEC